MRFHVLGLGSIGSLLAHHLRLVLPHHHDIILLQRYRKLAQLPLVRGGISVEHDGVVVSSKGFKFEVIKSTKSTFLNPPPSKPSPILEDRVSFDARLRIALEESRDQSVAHSANAIETLFVTSRTSQTLRAIEALLPRLSSRSTIVLFRNGLGIYDHLVQQFFIRAEERPHFVLASCTHGAWLRGLYHIVHTRVGEIVFGIVPDPMGRNFEASLEKQDPLSPQTTNLDDITIGPRDPSFLRYRSLRSTVAVLSSLQSLNSSWQPMSKMQITLRKQLVVGAVINSLTALMGCRNGDIFTQNASRRIAYRVCQEAAAAFSAEMVAETQKLLEKMPVHRKEQEDIPLGRTPSALRANRLIEEVFRAAHLTRGNISDMLLDIRHGKRTDIEYINGYLIGLGSKYRVPMPATATLLNLVKMRSAIPLDQQLGSLDIKSALRK